MKIIASKLLKIKAVILRPNNLFTWASNIKSPIYIDTRIIPSFIKTRQIIYHEIGNLIKKKWPDVELILGTATGAIAPACFIAQFLNLPVGYIRSKIKTHGSNRQIEAQFIQGKKTVIIEDLISTGQSVLSIANAARSNNLNVLGIAAIFSYKLKKATINLSAYQLLIACDIDQLLSVAVNENYITKEEILIIKKFLMRLNNVE